MSDEATARKQRSMAILRSESVPVIDHLPVIETERESTRRTQSEVADRAIALQIVALKGEGSPRSIVDKAMRELRAEGALSPEERVFVRKSAPTQQELVNFSWRYESLNVMLWALGVVDSLGRPDAMCDVSAMTQKIIDLGRDGLRERTRLRPQAEILDAADLIYRYHWATTDARINGRPAPAGLDNGIVYERHYALNWLIGYMGQGWDDISTDT